MSNLIVHTFNFINLNYADKFSVSLQSMNYLSSILGLTNMASYINFESTLDLLMKDMNYLNLINQMYYLVISHPNYSNSPNITSNVSIYKSNGDVQYTAYFSNITVDSAYDFIHQSEKLFSLRDRLGKNASLTPTYVASTNQTIYTKLASLRTLLKATSSTDPNGTFNFSLIQNNGFFPPLFSVWTTKTINTTAKPPYITPITSYDFSLICFICYLINQGVNNLLLDIDDQGVIEYYGIDAAQVLIAYITATKSSSLDDIVMSTIQSDGKFNNYCLQVKTLIAYCIALVNEIKNQVLMQGLPTYYILYCAFILCMTKRKNQMIEIAKLNLTISGNTLSFYPSGDITATANCVLFSTFTATY